MAALWLFLVVLGAPLLHAPVPRWDLLHALQCPLDGGRTLRGRRLLGDNKTWRGALCMIVGVVLATLVLWRWEWWRAQRPAAVRGSSPLLVGCLVGLGTVGGELRNSFPSAGWTSLRVRDGARPPGWRSPCSTSATWCSGSGWHFCRCGRCRCGSSARLRRRAAIHAVINVIGPEIGARTAPV